MKDLNLSICIPAYNYAQYLPYTIESCLKSDYNFELIIVDNGSTDNTQNLKNKYDGDERLKWYKNETTLPIVENWNYTVSLAQRKYVKLLLADDLLEANFFQLFDEAISLYPDQAIYGHLIKIIDSKGQILKQGTPYSLHEKYTLVSGSKYIQMKLQNIARFKETSSNFFLKEKWNEIGGFDSNYSFSFDLVFNSSLAFKFGGCLISEYGSFLRRHSASDNMSKKPDLSIKELSEFVKLLNIKLNSDIRKIDLIHGNAMLQYRIVELFFQRFKQNPWKSFLFFMRHARHFTYIRSYPQTMATIVRKYKTGDVQQNVENFK